MLLQQNRKSIHSSWTLEIYFDSQSLELISNNDCGWNVLSFLYARFEFLIKMLMSFSNIHWQFKTVIMKFWTEKQITLFNDMDFSYLFVWNETADDEIEHLDPRTDNDGNYSVHNKRKIWSTTLSQWLRWKYCCKVSTWKPWCFSIYKKNLCLWGGALVGTPQMHVNAFGEIEKHHNFYVETL